MNGVVDQDAVGLAERILALLDEGRFSATYKFAVLVALMDLCLENTGRLGAAPDMVTTRQMAEKLIELYWPQTALYTIGSAPSLVLRQGGGRDGGQAEIVARIAEFRETLSADPQCPLERARRQAPGEWRRLVDFAEWKLIEMPLPRLQRMGQVRDRFLYEIGWDENVRQSTVGRYQRDGGGGFDNRVQFRPRVGDALVRLHGLLRPLIHRKWAQMVAGFNQLDEARLEDFLFGVERISLEPVCGALRDLHNQRCFYCDETLRDGQVGLGTQIDHFIPWSRHPDNAVDNLVPAHERCNGRKRDFLAASEHLRRWRERIDERASDLALIAEHARFEHAADRLRSVARGIYLRLPHRATLWVRGDQFEVAGDANLRVVLAG